MYYNLGMEKPFVPKNLEVIRSPKWIVDCSLPGKSAKVLSDNEMKTETRLLLAQLPGNPDVLLYDEDLATDQQLGAISDKSLFLQALAASRARVFEVLNREIPTMMVAQTGFAKELTFAEKRKAGLPRWQALAGLSPQIARDCSTQDLSALRVKKSPWTGAVPFVLHTGSSGVVSSFLAEEHVFFGKDRGDQRCSAVTLAPDRSQTSNLYDFVRFCPQEQSLLFLWHAMQGCEVLHQSGFVHGDVKPENIFVSKSGGQLFDFDYAVPLGSRRTVGSGTQGYLDEAFTGRDYDYFHYFNHNDEDVQKNLPARDVFAFGMSIAGVVSQNAEWIVKITDGGGLKEVLAATLPSGPHRDLIADMTKLSRVDRPSLPEAINRLGRLIGQPELKF
jgi:hypothetical protein